MPLHPLDTSRRADQVQFQQLRAMTPEDKGALLTALTLAVQDLAMAGLRARFPDASDDELRLRFAAQRLGRDVVQRVWGWSVAEP